MNKTIWKFDIALSDNQTIHIPEDYELLSVGEQNGGLVLWAEVVPSNSKVFLTILIRGTGNPLYGNESNFIGTVQMPYGSVWHIYSGEVE